MLKQVIAKIIGHEPIICGWTLPQNSNYIPRFRYNLTKDSGTFEQNNDQGRYSKYHSENKEIQLVELI